MASRANAVVTSANGAVQVMIQTIKAPQGTEAGLAEIRKAVAAYNKLNPKAVPHAVVYLPHMAANTKGMQAALALLATSARASGATMIRIGMHNAFVALCGTPASIDATRRLYAVAHERVNTLCSQSYSPSEPGSRVGYINGYLCGAPAGMQQAYGVAPTLAYGIGYLFAFPVVGDGKAYRAGQAAALKAGKFTIPQAAPKAGKAPKQTPTAPATETATETAGEAVA